MSRYASDTSNRVLIGVMGPTGSGKTTFINLASRSNFAVGEGLESCTAEVNIAPEFKLDGRLVKLIDTPGFDDTNKSDTEILNLIAIHLEESYKTGQKLSGIIYFYRISDNRMGGNFRRNFRMFRKLCGDDALENVVIVTNMWSGVTRAKGEMREAELRDNFFKSALDKGATMLRHNNSVTSAHDILRCIIWKRPMPLQIQEELVDKELDIQETAAAEELLSQTRDLVREHQAKIRDLQKDMREATRMRDERAKQEIEATRRNLRNKINDMKNDMANIESKYWEERQNVEDLIERYRGDPPPRYTYRSPPQTKYLRPSSSVTPTYYNEPRYLQYPSSVTPMYNEPSYPSPGPTRYSRVVSPKSKKNNKALVAGVVVVALATGCTVQ